MDKNRINDMEYMKQELKANRRCIDFLGENLRKNPDFILEIAKDKDFKYHWALLRVVDQSLINTDFIISYVRALYDKGVMTTNSVYSLSGILPKDFRRGNKKLWDALIELGLIDHEISDIELILASGKRKSKFNEMMTRIDTVTVEEFKKRTNVINRNDPEFMLDVISKNPSLCVCLSEKLKANSDFVRLLISKVPEIEPIIKLDEEKRKEEYNQKEKEKQERKIELERQREETRKQKELEEQNRIVMEYKEQGEQHPNLILVNDFLEANTSKILFCKKHNIDIEQLNHAIKEVSFIYPEIATKVAKRNEQTSAIHLSTVESINNKLLSGEITPKQYSREFYKRKKIDTLLAHITDENERKQFHTLVVKAIASGELTMMDYMRLFSEEYDYKTIINNINTYMKTASKEMPELQGKDKPINMATIELKSLKKYSKPYKSKDFVGTERGFVNSDGKTEMVTITEEYLEYAKKYLHLEDEYICYLTMNSILSKLIKGEITFEDIDKRMTKTISMKSVVVNALNNGTTIDEVTYSDLTEKNKLQEKSIEGETINGE